MGSISWLPDSSERSLRDALAGIAPYLAARPIIFTPTVNQPNPLYWSGSAVVDGTFLVKFAWAEAPAVRVWREGALLRSLAATAPDLPIPRVVEVAQQPALTITEMVAGDPLSWEWANERSPAEARAVGSAIGAFLARLHGVPATPVLADLPHYAPMPQADTARLRAHYPALVDGRRAELVRRWCDWVDDALSPRSAVADVLVHGDLHGYNQLWDHRSASLELVVDFAETGSAEAEFDFRYLPGNCRAPEFTLSSIETYEKQAHRELDLRRVLAWNVRTHLGDALWRTEADVPLPGGGDAATWADEQARRLRDFGFHPD